MGEKKRKMMITRSFIFWRRSWAFLIPVALPLTVSVAQEKVTQSVNSLSAPPLPLLKEYSISQGIVPVGDLRQRFLNEARRARALLAFARRGSAQVYSLQKAYLLLVYFWSEATRFLFEGTLQGSFDAASDGGLQCDRFIDDIRACLSLNPKGEGFVGLIPEHDWNVDVTLGTVLKEKPTTPEGQEHQIRLVCLLLALGARPDAEATTVLSAIPPLQTVYNALQKWGYSVISKNPLVYIVDAVFFSESVSGGTTTPLLASIGMTLGDVLGRPNVEAKDKKSIPSGESNGKSTLKGNQKTGVDAQGESFQLEHSEGKLDNLMKGSSSSSHNASSGLSSEASQTPVGEADAAEGVGLDPSWVMSNPEEAEDAMHNKTTSENDSESFQVGLSESTADLNGNDGTTGKNKKNGEENKGSRQSFSGKIYYDPDETGHASDQHHEKLDVGDGSHYIDDNKSFDDVADSLRSETDVKQNNVYYNKDDNKKYGLGISNKKTSKYGKKKSSTNDYSFLLPNKPKPNSGTLEVSKDLDMRNGAHNALHHRVKKDRYDVAGQSSRSSKNNESNSGSFVDDQDILNCADEGEGYRNNKKNQKNNYKCLSPNKKSNAGLVGFPSSGHSETAFIVTIDGEDVPVRNSLSIHVR